MCAAAASATTGGVLQRYESSRARSLPRFPARVGSLRNARPCRRLHRQRNPEAASLRYVHASRKRARTHARWPGNRTCHRQAPRRYAPRDARAHSPPLDDDRTEAAGRGRGSEFIVRLPVVIASEGAEPLLADSAAEVRSERSDQRAAHRSALDERVLHVRLQRHGDSKPRAPNIAHPGKLAERVDYSQEDMFAVLRRIRPQFPLRHNIVTNFIWRGLECSRASRSGHSRPKPGKWDTGIAARRRDRCTWISRRRPRSRCPR